MSDTEVNPVTLDTLYVQREFIAPMRDHAFGAIDSIQTIFEISVRPFHNPEREALIQAMRRLLYDTGGLLWRLDHLHPSGDAIFADASGGGVAPLIIRADGDGHRFPNANRAVAEDAELFIDDISGITFLKQPKRDQFGLPIVRSYAERDREAQEFLELHVCENGTDIQRLVRKLGEHGEPNFDKMRELVPLEQETARARWSLRIDEIRRNPVPNRKLPSAPKPVHANCRSNWLSPRQQAEMLGLPYTDNPIKALQTIGKLRTKYKEHGWIETDDRKNRGVFVDPKSWASVARVAQILRCSGKEHPELPDAPQVIAGERRFLCLAMPCNNTFKSADRSARCPRCKSTEVQEF